MIEPRYGVLQTLFADRVFRIPHYQRFYSWQRRQRQDLFGDLSKLATGTDDQHHFMATIVCHKTAETKDVGASQYRVYDIVDGQQRLTTLILLLKCIELALDKQSDERSELGRILVKRDGHLILLQTNNANELNFNRFIREGRAPQDADIQTYSDGNLAAAIRECSEYVETWKSTSGVLDLMRLVLHRLGFVVFDTEDSRLVYTVFEVLNSRGLAVDWLDKTKSVLMGRAFELAATPAAMQAEMGALQNIWGNIYREIAKEDIPGDEILRITATLYYGPGQGKPRSAEESLDLLKEKCQTFDQPRKISERLLGVARKLVELHASPYLGPVTAILHARLLAVAIKSATGVSEAERARLLDQWERVTFRIFGLFDKDSRTKVGDYVRLAARIVGDDIDTRTYNQIMKALREIGQEYPFSDALEQELAAKDWYDHPEECRYVLWSYEEHLAKSLGAAATVDENEKGKVWKLRAADSIEHVFPQNHKSPAWQGKMKNAHGEPQDPMAHVGRIGNLLLLPERVNKEAQDRAFAEKKMSYAKHNLRMIHQIREVQDWTFVDIQARDKEVLTWASTRWSDL